VGPVVILGPGKIGYFVTKLLRHHIPNSDVIVIGKDEDEKRLEAFTKEGIRTLTFRSKRYAVTPHNLILDSDKLDKPQLIFDCSGSPDALGESISMLGRKGRLVVVGLYEEGGEFTPHILSSIVREEKTIIGASGALPEDYDIVIKYIDAGFISRDILSEFSIKDCDLAFTKFLRRETITALLKING